mmetsp:Transcript_13466/g.38237  ORF Transcript_13466/g.38237 Transcript_13466/m.38237 type:complete len:123 (-) Transcript_13466:1436-1804(-)
MEEGTGLSYSTSMRNVVECSNMWHSTPADLELRPAHAHQRSQAQALGDSPGPNYSGREGGGGWGSLWQGHPGQLASGIHSCPSAVAEGLLPRQSDAPPNSWGSGAEASAVALQMPLACTHGV